MYTWKCVCVCISNPHEYTANGSKRLKNYMILFGM